ncbi:MAG: hypothetical protein ACYC7D_14390 [Nitrososphaerales archaeon]
MRKNGEDLKEVKGLQRVFEILANDDDDAKVRAKHLLAAEGYEEKQLHHATWAFSRLDRQRKARD